MGRDEARPGEPRARAPVPRHGRGRASAARSTRCWPGCAGPAPTSASGPVPIRTSRRPTGPGRCGPSRSASPSSTSCPATPSCARSASTGCGATPCARRSRTRRRPGETTALGFWVLDHAWILVLFQAISLLWELCFPLVFWRPMRYPVHHRRAAVQHRAVDDREDRVLRRRSPASSPSCRSSSGSRRCAGGGPPDGSIRAARRAPTTRRAPGAPATSPRRSPVTGPTGSGPCPAGTSVTDLAGSPPARLARRRRPPPARRHTGSSRSRRRRPGSRRPRADCEAAPRRWRREQLTTIGAPGATRAATGGRCRSVPTGAAERVAWRATAPPTSPASRRTADAGAVDVP